MKDKIQQIIISAQLGGISSNEAAQQVLDLFAVVGRSEQLLAFKKWEAEKCKLPWDASPEQIIEQYLSQ